MLIEKQIYLRLSYNHVVDTEFLSSNAFSKYKSHTLGVSWFRLLVICGPVFNQGVDSRSTNGHFKEFCVSFFRNKIC